MGKKKHEKSKKVIVEAKFTSGFGGNDKLDKFHDAVFIYLVSVGKDNFRKEVVEKTVTCIAKYKPKKTIVLVADELQRFNIVAEDVEIVKSNQEQMRAATQQKNYMQVRDVVCKLSTQKNEEAGKAGKEFINENKESFSKYLPSHEIISWKQVNNIHEMKAWYKKFDALCNDNNCKKNGDELKKSLIASIEEYKERTRKRLGDGKFKSISATFDYFCKEYLIEECGVYDLLAQQLLKDDHKKIYIIYPGKETDFLKKTREIFINPNFKSEGSVFDWIPVHFKRKKLGQICKQRTTSFDQSIFNPYSLFGENNSPNNVPKSLPTKCGLSFQIIGWSCFVEKILQITPNTEKEYLITETLKEIKEANEQLMKLQTFFSSIVKPPKSTSKGIMKMENNSPNRSLQLAIKFI